MSRDLKIVAAAIFAWALGEGLFFYMVPLYMAELGASPALIGLLVALFALAQMVTMIPAGIATDRWGARNLFVGGWLLGLATTSLMAGATNLKWFALGYVAYGFSGAVMPALTSYIINSRGTLTPERVLTRVLSFFSAGMVISPFLGGLVAETYGLRTTFRLAAIFFATSTAIVIWTRRQAPRPVATGERRYAGLLRQRNVIAFLGIVFAITFVLTLGMPLAPNFLQERWGVSVSQVGLLGSATSVGAVMLALFLGGRPPRRILILLQAGGLIYLVTLLWGGQLGWLLLGFFLQAGGHIARQFMDAISTRIVKSTQLGLAFAFNNTVSRAAAVAAAALAGQLYAIRPSLPFILGLLLIPLAAGLTWLKAPREGIANDPSDMTC